MEGEMKLVTFRTEGSVRIGAAEPTRARILDLTAASGFAPGFASMLALIDAGASGLREAQRLVDEQEMSERCAVALDVAELLAPLPEPRQMRDFSVFPTHIRQAPCGMQRIAARRRGDEGAAAAARPLPEVPAIYREQPIYYITNRFSVAGPDTDIVWPAYSDLMDFELEFGVVIGKLGRDIKVEDAADHIFGYTIYNDFSARDTQNFEMQGMLGPAKGKSFDGGNVLGPWIVTADEIPDPGELAMTVRVNGETWASGSSADMLFSFDEMIAYVSRGETLYPGEFFGSGTMGNGCGLELDRFLSHGDVVELEVEGLGVLRNRVLRRASLGVAAE
jgi:2-keto-4-pentenoate hydratase/2-oxohepta-3-ene-1,7-dioic acid hydratase in catechol pathway